MLKLSRETKERQITDIVQRCLSLSREQLSHDTSNPNYVTQKLQLLLFNHFSLNFAPRYLLEQENVGAFYLDFIDFIAGQIKNPTHETVPLEYAIELKKYISIYNTQRERAGFESWLIGRDKYASVHKI